MDKSVLVKLGDNIGSYALVEAFGFDLVYEDGFILK